MNSDTEKEENIIRKKLKEQIEFYFSDANLINDKYLSRLVLINKEGYVDFTVFLKFNKINGLLGEIDNYQRKNEFIRDALKISEVLKLSVDEGKVKRIIPFSKEKNVLDCIDNRTIYVENFPTFVDHDLFEEIFLTIGIIECISLPKFSETKVNKGYAFITFKDEEAVQLAIDNFNNSIPGQFIKDKPRTKLIPLRILTKKRWLEYKEDFKKLKKEYFSNSDAEEASENNGEAIKKVKPSPETSSLSKACLLRLKNIDLKKISKKSVGLILRQIINPAYIDFSLNEGIIIRFHKAQDRDFFISKKEEFMQLIGKDEVIECQIVEGEEEDKYLERVMAFKVKYKEKNS